MSDAFCRACFDHLAHGACITVATVPVIERPASPLFKDITFQRTLRHITYTIPHTPTTWLN